MSLCPLLTVRWTGFRQLDTQVLAVIRPLCRPVAHVEPGQLDEIIRRLTYFMHSLTRLNEFT